MFGIEPIRNGPRILPLATYLIGYFVMTSGCSLVMGRLLCASEQVCDPYAKAPLDPLNVVCKICCL